MRIRDWLAEKTGTVRVIATVIACLIGAQVVIPGINTGVLADFFRSGGASPLLRLYDWFVGGALGRGAFLGLGVMPYITARIYMRLWRVVSPGTVDPARQKTRTRWLTLGFSLVQSYGFARFAQSLPGAVADPGPRFIVTTMLALTGSAMTAMWLWELPRHSEDDSASGVDEQRDEASEPVVSPAAEVPLLNAPATAFESSRKREPVILDRR